MKRFIQLTFQGIRNQAYYYYPLACALVGIVKLPFFRGGAKKVEIGAGPRARVGFVTLDCSLRCDLPWDLRLGLPFKSSSIDLIYAEHVLEHFDHNDLLQLLRSCFRVLKPGGCLKISVPNVELYVNAYNEKNSSFLSLFCQHKPALHYYSYVDYLNYMFYMNGEHRTMFDANNMAEILKAAGASVVSLREFEPDLDRDIRKHESLLVVATK